MPFAQASSLSEVKELFIMGRFDEAQTAAIKMNTAEGYAIASESLLAQILLGEVGKLNTHSKFARSLAKNSKRKCLFYLVVHTIPGGACSTVRHPKENVLIVLN